jgi:hypothetical protein
VVVKGCLLSLHVGRVVAEGYPACSVVQCLDALKGPDRVRQVPAHFPGEHSDVLTGLDNLSHGA